MRTAAPTISVAPSTNGGFVATATFPPGLFASRKPVHGAASASVAGALGNLLHNPLLATTLHRAITSS